VYACRDDFPRLVPSKSRLWALALAYYACFMRLFAVPLKAAVSLSVCLQQRQTNASHTC
jgi:hypothetical protein